MTLTRCPCPCDRLILPKPGQRRRRYFSRACVHRMRTTEQRREWGKRSWATRARVTRQAVTCPCPCGRSFIPTKKSRRFFGRGCWSRMSTPAVHRILRLRRRRSSNAIRARHLRDVAQRVEKYRSKAECYIVGDQGGYRRSSRWWRHQGRLERTRWAKERAGLKAEIAALQAELVAAKASGVAA